MNRANGKNVSGSNADAFVERLNKKIGRILGKNNKYKLAAPPKTSNGIFVLIIAIVLLLLWAITGFYYLSDNQSGVILRNGIIIDVVKGVKVGFTWPYPFGNIEVVDTGISNLVKITKDDIDGEDYIALTSDLVPIKVAAKFSYQVDNPKLLFLNILQKNDDLDEVVRYIVWQKLHAYIAYNSKSDIAKANLTVMADSMRTEINNDLNNFGLRVVKLEINSLNYPTFENVNDKFTLEEKAEQSSVDVNATPNSAIPPIATELLLEAKKYQTDTLMATRANIDKFNQLLPQYKLNRESVSLQMYYDMLKAIPQTNQYQLLSLGLSDLMMAYESTRDTNNFTNDGEQSLRTVNRSRNLDGRK